MSNKTLKFTLYLFLIGLCVTFIFWLIGPDKLTWLRFINTASMVGLAYIVIGGFMFVYYGGFFRGIAFSFRNFFKPKGVRYAEEISKNMDEIDRPNQKQSLPERLEYGIARQRPPITWAFIFNAIIFFVGSLMLSYLLF